MCIVSYHVGKASLHTIKYFLFRFLIGENN